MKKFKRILSTTVLLGIVAIGILKPFDTQAECEGCTPNINYVCCEGAFFTDEGHKIFWEIPGLKFLIKME